MTSAEFEQWLTLPRALRRPLVLGVLNVTPDSFSDGGRFADESQAVDAGLQLLADGADCLDVGGESTRPGSQPVAEREQIRRVEPVIRRIHAQTGAALSVDTTRGAVARAAFEGGACIVNDIFAGRDDDTLLPLAARAGAAVILMHMQGTPVDMQTDPRYSDVLQDVKAFLSERSAAAESAGVARHRVLVDPGIGFGKTVRHNLQLLRGLGELARGPQPLVVGTSRKGFIGRVTGEADAGKRQFGTAATVAWSVAQGASMVRVHDVRAMAQVLRMVRAIQLGDEEVPPVGGEESPVANDPSGRL